jgi:hypothetical protein
MGEMVNGFVLERASRPVGRNRLKAIVTAATQPERTPASGGRCPKAAGPLAADPGRLARGPMAGFAL